MGTVLSNFNVGERFFKKTFPRTIINNFKQLKHTMKTTAVEHAEKRRTKEKL